jgi:N-acetylglutamate synthase-like GNAT family acetyltransferase
MLQFEVSPAQVRVSKIAPDTAVRLRPACPDDWPALTRLLAAMRVSGTGLRAHLGSTFVLERGHPRYDDGQLLGCVAVEPGPTALVRSLAVTAEGQERGYDGLLLNLALKLAARTGAVDAVLLVETAAQVPAYRLESVQWSDLRVRCGGSALVRELSAFDSMALAVRMPLPGPTRVQEIQ